MAPLLEALNRGLLYVAETIVSRSAAAETSLLGLLHLPTSTRFRTFPPQEALMAIDAHAVHFSFLFIWLPLALPFLMLRDEHYAQNGMVEKLSFGGRMTQRIARGNRRVACFLTFLRVWAAAILLAWLLDQQRAKEGHFVKIFVQGCVLVDLL